MGCEGVMNPDCFLALRFWTTIAALKGLANHNNAFIDASSGIDQTRPGFTSLALQI